MKKHQRIIIIIFCIIIIFLSKKVNQKIYTTEYFEKKHEQQYINTKTHANYLNRCHKLGKKCSSIPHQSFRADIIRLRSIQHAGQNNLFHYNKSLYHEIETLTNLNPYRQYPYVFTQFLLPIQKHSFITHPEINSGKETLSRNQTTTIGEKGINFLCNKNKCFDFKLPQTLAFTFFYYLNNTNKAIHYYKIAANSPNASRFLKNMPAIIEGRIGNHLTSAIMWYEKFSTVSIDDLQAEYFIQKALFEYTLHLIETTDKNQKICHQNLKCLQKNKLITKTIYENQKNCKIPKNNKQQIYCILLQYGLDNNFITTKGFFIYPLDPKNFIYGYRPDISDWWIIPLK